MKQHIWHPRSRQGMRLASLRMGKSLMLSRVFKKINHLVQPSRQHDEEAKRCLDVWRGKVEFLNVKFDKCTVELITLMQRKKWVINEVTKQHVVVRYRIENHYSAAFFKLLYSFDRMMVVFELLLGCITVKQRRGLLRKQRDDVHKVMVLMGEMVWKKS